MDQNKTEANYKDASPHAIQPASIFKLCYTLANLKVSELFMTLWTGE
jgi:hypothetical protein